MSVHLFYRVSLVLGAAAILAALGSHRATAQLLYQETFESDGDGTRYELFDRGHEDTSLPDQASGWGIWGHNFDAAPTEIGLLSTAPAKRAAIAWTHDDPVEDLADLATDEALGLWVSLVDWAVDGKEMANIGVFPSTFPLGSFLLTETLEAAGHSVEEIPTVDDATEDLDLLIQTSEIESASFTELKVPVISFRAANLDDLAVTKVGQTIDFSEPVELDVPAEAEGHPALGGLSGTVPYMSDAVRLDVPGPGHNGGTTLATVVYEDPNTFEEVEAPALFVIEEGDPLLGAFNPDPEGDGYIIGAALDKFGDLGEKTLTTPPIDISGKTDLSLSVLLAATRSKR